MSKTSSEVRLPICPRCALRSFDPEGIDWGRSRREGNVPICNVCTKDEALRDWASAPYVPVSEWPVEPVLGQAFRNAERDLR